MVIAKTASRNVAFKAAGLSDSIFDHQSEILMTEAATVDSPSQEDDFDDVGCNAELYASRQDAFQGFSISVSYIAQLISISIRLIFH